MDFTEFLNRYYQGVPCAQRVRIAKLCEKFGHLVEYQPQNAAVLTRRELCSLWYNSGHISKTKFFEVKTFTVNLYRWLEESGYVSQEQREAVEAISVADVLQYDNFSVYHYLDERDLDDTIQTVGRSVGLDGPDDLLNLRAAALLLWSGLNVKTLLELKKTEIDPQRGTVSTAHGAAELSPFARDIVLRYAAVDNVRSFPSGKRQIYLDSPYLFRTGVCPRLNAKNFSGMLARFNKVAEPLHKQLYAPALNRNGQFVKIYALEQQGCGLSEAVAQALHTQDRQAIYAMKPHYAKWKQTFGL